MSAKIDSAGISYRPRPFRGENAPKFTVKRKLAFVANANRPDKFGYPSPPMSIPPSPSGTVPSELPTITASSTDQPVGVNPPPIATTSEPVPHLASSTFFSPPTTSSSFDLPTGLPETIPRLETERAPSQSPSAPFPTALTSTATAGPSLPRSGRRPKAHVASACVNCKRAHLSCDVQRPCTRCIASGKQVRGNPFVEATFSSPFAQDTCIDVPHKKRGRPRLREESEFKTQQTTSHQASQATTIAGSSQHPARVFAGTRSRRAESFRSMQSQTSDDTASYAGSTPGMGPYGTLQSPLSTHSVPPRASGSRLIFDVATALLNLDLTIIRANRPFESIMLRGREARGCHIAEIAAPADAEAFQTIRNRLRAEREAREPAYMPPIQQPGQDPVLQISEQDAEQYTVGFSDRTYTWTYVPPRVTAETFPARIRLAKASTYFVMLTLPSFRPQEPAPPPMYSGTLVFGPPIHPAERFGPSHAPALPPALPTTRALPRGTLIAAPSIPISAPGRSPEAFPLLRPGFPLTPSYSLYPSGPAAAPRLPAAEPPTAPASFSSAAAIQPDPVAYQLPPIAAGSVVAAPQGSEPTTRAQPASSSEEEGLDGRPRSSKKRRMDIGDVLRKTSE